MSATVYGYDPVQAELTDEIGDDVVDGLGRAISAGATVRSFDEFMSFGAAWTCHWLEIIRQHVWRESEGTVKLMDLQIIQVLYQRSKRGDVIWGYQSGAAPVNQLTGEEE